MHDMQIDYWRVRETEERAAYDAETEPRIADIHLALAERYADAIWSAEERLYERKHA